MIYASPKTVYEFGNQKKREIYADPMIPDNYIAVVIKQSFRVYYIGNGKLEYKTRGRLEKVGFRHD